MIWNGLEKYRNAGLLLLRVGAGLYVILGHGWSKITAGPERWEQLGETMELFGLGFLPVFWGFMCALAESVGALLVAAGLLFRPALVLLILNMIVVAGMHLITGNGSPERAILYGIIFLGLLFIGPGKYSLDARLGGRR